MQKFIRMKAVGLDVANNMQCRPNDEYSTRTKEVMA